MLHAESWIALSAARLNKACLTWLKLDTEVIASGGELRFSRLRITALWSGEVQLAPLPPILPHETAHD